MKSIFGLILVLPFLPFSSVANAPNYQLPLENFFQLYNSGRIDRAVELVYLNNRDRNDPEASIGVADKQEQLIELSDSLGLFHGYQLLGEHKIGDRLKHFSFVLFHQKEPVRLEFAYYKPNDKWLLTELNIDTNLQSELKELARKDIAGYLVAEDLKKSDIKPNK